MHCDPLRFELRTHCLEPSLGLQLFHALDGLALRCVSLLNKEWSVMESEIP